MGQAKLGFAGPARSAPNPVPSSTFPRIAGLPRALLLSARRLSPRSNVSVSRAHGALLRVSPSGGRAPPLPEASAPRCAPLQQARFLKAVVAEVAGVGGGLAENDVVEQVDADDRRGFAELARDLDVRAAGRGVAAGVVVRADDRGGAGADRLAVDLARVYEAVAGCAGGDFADLEQAVLAVEAERPELLDLEADDVPLHGREDAFGRVEHGLHGRRDVHDAAADLHDGDELERLDLADALDLAELVVGPIEKAAERAGFLEDLGGDAEDVAALAAAAQDHGEQLGVAERARAECDEALLRALGDGEI